MFGLSKLKRRLSPIVPWTKIQHSISDKEKQLLKEDPLAKAVLSTAYPYAANRTKLFGSMTARKTLWTKARLIAIQTHEFCYQEKEYWQCNQCKSRDVCLFLQAELSTPETQADLSLIKQNLSKRIAARLLPVGQALMVFGFGSLSTSQTEKIDLLTDEEGETNELHDKDHH